MRLSSTAQLRGLSFPPGRILRCRPGGTHGYDPVPRFLFRRYRPAGQRFRLAPAVQQAEGERLKIQFFPKHFIAATADRYLLPRFEDGNIIILAVRLKAGDLLDVNHV